MDAIRLTNAKGKNNEKTINKGFMKVRVENSLETIVSFDEKASSYGGRTLYNRENMDKISTTCGLH